MQLPHVQDVLGASSCYVLLCHHLPLRGAYRRAVVCSLPFMVTFAICIIYTTTFLVRIPTISCVNLISRLTVAMSRLPSHSFNI